MKNARVNWARLMAAGAVMFLVAGCITIGGSDKPIQINVDVTVHVQKDLDNFFGDIDKK